MGMRILVVDDDEGIREFVGWALADEGYEIMAAPDGAAALKLSRKVRPDLILLDMRMPVMDGWEFARAFRAVPGLPVPVVLMTAARDAAALAAEIHADGYLAKPFDLSELLEVVGRYRPED